MSREALQTLFVLLFLAGLTYCGMTNHPTKQGMQHGQ